MLSSGSRFGRYEIRERLGAGGMGEVYRARDSQLKRDVALKILPTELALEPERLARFEREAQALAALNHPHIAQVYGFAHDGDVRAIAMELVEGPTLAERIAHGPLPPDEALHWLEHACSKGSSYYQMLSAIWLLSSLHDDVRFQELMARMKQQCENFEV